MDLIRLESLIGKENVEKITKLNILIIGLGGVGGYSIESLIRSGVGSITLVDGDTINSSNINRQLIATSKNMKKYKTKEWKKRIKLINPDAKVSIINRYITVKNIDTLFDTKYDYIIDACDTTLIKVKLIEMCYEKGIKLISCMGTAKKLDAAEIKITSLDKTEYDPLAKRIRKELSRKKDIMKSVVVVTSNEKAIDTNELGSTSYVPGVAGLLITNYIINDVIKS